MIQFIKNYLNPKCKKLKVDSYISWFFLGLVIQFLYNIYAFIIKHNMAVYLSVFFGAFVSSIIGILISWLVHSLILYIIYRIILKGKDLSLRRHLLNYLPYYISQNLYFIITVLILSLLSIHNDIFIKITELLFIVYTYTLYIIRERQKQ